FGPGQFAQLSVVRCQPGRMQGDAVDRRNGSHCSHAGGLDAASAGAATPAAAAGGTHETAFPGSSLTPAIGCDDAAAGATGARRDETSVRRVRTTWYGRTR